MINLLLTQRVLVTISILFSGLCWYFSFGFSGESWYLLWLAPIPILVLSFRVSGKMIFIISFIAYLIGRLSWFSYLVTVATIVPAIIFTLLLPLFFAFIMIITRRTIVKTNSWYAVFAFPVFFTTFEYLWVNLSPDGTAGSIAYTQSNFLPAIQIASVTGILGITFLVCFIPSAIAIGLHYRREKIKFRYILTSAIVIIGSILLFGAIRFGKGSEKSGARVGLAVLDERLHNITDHPDLQKEKLAVAYYAKQVSDLAARGAELVVLPERAFNITSQPGDSTISVLSNAAKQNHVFIITGYTNFKNDQERNSALVINSEGNVILDYNKVHLVKVMEDQFTPGSEPGLFKLNGMQVGTAICKDLDFPDYIKKYGVNNVTLLYIPAWDFVKDDWLHSRMAILRGVENGFAEVRNARQGRLTISDCYGRVTHEASSADGKAAMLLGEVSVQKRETIYTRFPDWFGIANLIAAVCLVFFGGRKKEKI
ncbi:MAG: nitrilase-related carbon-nitrogen hydrolase [Ferruginibacter sp.]